MFRVLRSSCEQFFRTSLSSERSKPPTVNTSLLSHRMKGVFLSLRDYKAQVLPPPSNVKKLSKEEKSLLWKVGLAMTVIFVSEEVLRYAFSSQRVLSSQLLRAIKSGEETRVSSELSKVEEAANLTSWGKMDIYKAGVKKTVESGDENLFSTVLSHVGSSDSLGSWQKSLVYQEGLMRVIDQRKEGMIGPFFSEAKISAIEPLDLSRVCQKSLKRSSDLGLIGMTSLLESGMSKLPKY